MRAIRMQVGETDGPRRCDDPKGPGGQAPKEFEVSLQERAEAADFGVRREVEEYRATVQIDPNREFLEKGATDTCRWLADAGGRQAIRLDSRQRGEGLLFVGRKPDELRVREHSVKEHQTMDDTGGREWSAMATVGLSDRPIQGLAMHLVDASAIVSTRERACVPAPNELCEELARLLSVDDAGKGGVLTLQTHTRVQHDGHQETRLTPRESEVGDSLNALCKLHQNTSEA
jgi:hypothetical protein